MALFLISEPFTKGLVLESRKLVSDYSLGEIVQAFWNLNDGFHVTLWFLQGMIARIADNHIVPIDELHRRVTKLVQEEIDYTFKQLKENGY